MHNVELLIVTTGRGNWKGASDSILKAKMLLDEIERDIKSEITAEAEERRRRAQQSVRMN